MGYPRIGLALGSGGLRGMAHIGVLRVLERENIPISCIAGCSIGSLIGGLHAAGLDSGTILKLALNLKRRHWLDFVMPKMGLVAGDRTLDMLRILTQRKVFDELNIPLAVVATELTTGEEIVFNEGEVAPAIRASISVPGVFVPFRYQEHLLVDGAVVNPTPIDIAHRMGADIVVAVDLVPTREEANVRNIFDVMIQTIDIIERQLFKQREPLCDVLIRPDVAHISPSSFDSTEECVNLGERAMLDALPEIKRLMVEREYDGANEENPNSRCHAASPEQTERRDH